MPEINKTKKYRFLNKKACSVLFLLGVFALTLAGLGGFLDPKPAQAADPNCDNSRTTLGADPRICQLSGFSLKTDVLVQDPKNPGSFVQGNFIRVGNESGSQISFKVQITLQAPQDLIIGTDKVYFPSATSRNLTISGFGSTITPQDTKNTCGTSWSTTFTFGHDTYDKCQSDGNVTGSGIGSYDDIQRPASGTTFKPGSIVYTSKVFTIPQRDFLNKFRIANVNGLNQITAFPNMEFAYTASNDWTTFIKGGFNIYVQLYPTDAAALADAGKAPPSGVPGYGGTTANGSNVGGGGSGLLALLNELIGFILGLIQELLYLIFYWLVAPLIQAMLSIRTYSDGFAAVIYPGWVVVRNVCNIIFIVALIAIGLGTLFRLESYQYKHLLVQLILAALLVNFSLVIAQAILGVADTVQSQFLPNDVGVIRSLAKNLILAYRNDVYTKNFMSSGYFANTIKPLFMLMLAFGSFMVFLAIGAYLAIRIVMLWVLLLISPVAYAAGVLPQTSHYRGEWWQTFLKYAFFTPIMAFFLNMAAVMVDASQTNPILNKILQDPSVIGSDSSFASFVVSVGSNILLLVFLLVGLKVAETAGVFGASTITKWSKGVMFAPAGLTGKGLKTLGKTIMRGYSGYMGTKAFEAVQGEVKAKQAKTALQAGLMGKERELATLQADPNADPAEIARLKQEIGDIGKDVHKAEHEEHRQARRKRNFGLAQFLNPMAVKKGWEARSKILEHRAYAPAEGSVHDMLNRYMPTEWGVFYKGRKGLGRVTDYGFVDKLAVIRDEAKHLESLSLNRNFAVYAMDNAAETGSWEERMGQALLISKQNQQDDVANLTNEDNGFTYSGYNDLMYLRKKVWSTMSPAAREIMAVQLLEEQEGTGRGRSMFFNENRNSTVDDLSYMKDQKGFKEAMEQVAVDLRETKVDENIALANQMDQMVAQGKGLNDIVDNNFNPKQGMEKVHEAIVSSDVARIVGGKQRRGNIRKWLTGMNPAEVRDQTTNGWEKYTMMGLMKIMKAPKALLQVYLRRMHEGEVRTAIYGGATIDRKTGAIRMPYSHDQAIAKGMQVGSADYKFEMQQYKEWQKLTKAKPELSASVATFFVHPRAVETVLDEVGAGKWGIDPEHPEQGIKLVSGTNPDGTQIFGESVDLDRIVGGARAVGTGGGTGAGGGTGGGGAGGTP